jgi:hypothetical protein
MSDRRRKIAPPQSQQKSQRVLLNQLWLQMPEPARGDVLQILGRMVVQRLPVLRQTKEVKDEHC